MTERGKRFRQQQEKGASRRRTMREAVPIEGIRQFNLLYEGQRQTYERIAGSSFYYYSRSELNCAETIGVTTELADSMNIDPDSFHWASAHLEALGPLYATTTTSQQRFYEAQMETATRFHEINTYVPPDELPAETALFLNDGYQLVHSLHTINDATPKMGKIAAGMKSVQKVALMQAFAKVEKTKPEAFRETMRRYIPRWMHHPIELPDAAIPEEQKAGVQRLWSGYTTRDADYLIHPDSLAQGKAPLHKALQAATTIEEQGNPDLAYTLKASAITQLLTIENERGSAGGRWEYQFFRRIIGGIMAGDVGKPPKNAHYNYQAALDTAFKQTVERLQQELATDTNGPARTFVSALVPNYREHLPGLLIRAMHRHAKDSSSLFTLLKTMDEKQFPDASVYREKLEELAERRVLTTTELTTLAQTLPEFPNQKHRDPEATIADVTTILGDDDLHTFSSKLTNTEAGVQLGIQVELDAASEYITAHIQHTKGDTIRHIPFELGFSGERESFDTDTLDQNEIPDATIDTYRRLVMHLIQEQAEQKRNAEARKARSQNADMSRFTSTDEPVQVLTRADRLALYENRKATKRGKLARVKAETVFPAAETVQAEPKGPSITLQGARISEIQTKLTEKKIEVISAEEVEERLQKTIETATVGRKMLGKRVNLDSVGKDAEGINLRQIGWTLDSSTALRIFLQDMGNGVFHLRGILSKKGFNKQQAYIRDIVKDIRDEQAADEAEKVAG